MKVRTQFEMAHRAWNRPLEVFLLLFFFSNTQSNTDWSVTASDGNPAVELWSTFCSLPTARFEQKVGPLDAVTELECKKELGCSYQFHNWEASASFQCHSLFLLADNKQTNP